jgi:hypothetical protein
VPTTINGRTLGVARNGIFSTENTDAIPGGRLWGPAAASWNWMRRDFIAAGGRPGDFMPAGPASSARSVPQQQGFWANQPPPAAYPGTSNHGWGIAVDVVSRVAAEWIMRNGHRYGWSWDEGQRVGEWWHFRCVRVVKPPKRDALAHLRPDERRWCRELDRLRCTRRDPDRQRVLERVLTKRRKDIWRAAQESGWSKRNRAKRYRSIKARTA